MTKHIQRGSGISIEGRLQEIVLRYLTPSIEVRTGSVTGRVRAEFDGGVRPFDEESSGQLEGIVPSVFQGPQSVRVGEFEVYWQGQESEICSFGKHD